MAAVAAVTATAEADGKCFIFKLVSTEKELIKQLNPQETKSVCRMWLQRCLSGQRAADVIFVMSQNQNLLYLQTEQSSSERRCPPVAVSRLLLIPPRVSLSKSVTQSLSLHPSVSRVPFPYSVSHSPLSFPLFHPVLPVFSCQRLTLGQALSPAVKLLIVFSVLWALA